MKLLLSSIALSLLMTTPAIAAAKKNNYPFFVKLSVGIVDSSNAEEEAVNNLANLGHDVISYDFDSGSGSFQAELGYSLTEHWAVTAGYMSFGATSFDPKIKTEHDIELIDDLARTAPRYGNGNTFSLVYSLDLASSVVASVDVGVIYLESKSAVQVGVTSFEIKDHSVQYFLSAGLDYQLNDYTLGLYVRHYEIDDAGTEWFGVRVGYNF